MDLLDMMREQVFNERMAAAEGHGALVRMSTDLADAKDYDGSLLAWLLTGSHDWDQQAYDYIADSCYES